MPPKTINHVRMAFSFSGASALKEPSFLQRAIFSSATEGMISEGIKRTGIRFCCFKFKRDKIGGTVAASS